MRLPEPREVYCARLDLVLVSAPQGHLGPVATKHYRKHCGHNLHRLQPDIQAGNECPQNLGAGKIMGHKYSDPQRPQVSENKGKRVSNVPWQCTRRTDASPQLCLKCVQLLCPGQGVALGLAPRP